MEQKKSRIRAVLLPGLDGTGILFGPFVSECPDSFVPQVTRFPADERITYHGLRAWTRERVPFGEPWILVAESFSTPLAALLAQDRLDGLLGVVLCAGFVRSPVPESYRHLPWSSLFRLSAPDWILRRYLVGDASNSVMMLLRTALRDVPANVLAARVRAIANVDCRDAMRRSAVPMLYIRALRDNIVGEGSWHEIAALRPDCHSVTIDAPHMVLQHSPEAAWAAIGGFLRAGQTV